MSECPLNSDTLLLVGSACVNQCMDDGFATVIPLIITYILFLLLLCFTIHLFMHRVIHFLLQMRMRISCYWRRNGHVWRTSWCIVLLVATIQFDSLGESKRCIIDRYSSEVTGSHEPLSRSVHAHPIDHFFRLVTFFIRFAFWARLAGRQ